MNPKNHPDNIWVSVLISNSHPTLIYVCVNCKPMLLSGLHIMQSLSWKLMQEFLPWLDKSTDGSKYPCKDENQTSYTIEAFETKLIIMYKSLPQSSHERRRSDSIMYWKMGHEW
jgi:hypothetical protein